MNPLDTLIAHAKESFDLSEPDDQATVLALAEARKRYHYDRH